MGNSENTTFLDAIGINHPLAHGIDRTRILCAAVSLPGVFGL